MLWDEEPVKITQTDRKVGNRIFVQTLSFLFIPAFVKIKTGAEVSSQIPEFACSSLKCCSHPQLSWTCQQGDTGSWPILVSSELCWLGTDRAQREGECFHPEQAFWTGKLKQKTGHGDEELPICTARPQKVKPRLNTTQKYILRELATPGLKHCNHT